MFVNPVFIDSGGIKLQDIQITKLPTNIDYLVGDTFDPSGMVVSSVYSNGATKTITDYTYSPTGPLIEGTNVITITYSEDGETVTKTLNVSAEILSIIVPTVSGSLVYDGSSQSPDWNGYDPDRMSITGTTSATDAGIYQAIFTLNNKIGTKWADGTTEDKTVSWSISKAVLAYPSQNGSLVYNGSSQSPVWNNYDPNKMTIGGVTSGVNAGSYSADFTPKPNYKWPDSSEGVYSVAWSISKATGSLSISPTSITLGVDNNSKTITVTRSGDGVITAQSNNTGIATVQVNGNIVTVTGTGSNGNAVITVSVGEGTNYTAPSNKTCSVSASYIVAGYTQTLTASSGTWTCPATGSWKIEMHGGGGGGGGGFSGWYSEYVQETGGMGAGGGGSGQMYDSVNFTKGQSISYTVGRGGNGGSSRYDPDSEFGSYEGDRSGWSGGTGGTTTFGTYSVAGGGGGGGSERGSIGGVQCQPGTASGNLATDGEGYYRGWGGPSVSTGSSTGNSTTSMNKGGDGGGVGNYGDGGDGGIGRGLHGDPFMPDNIPEWDEIDGSDGKNGAIILTFLG